MSSSNLIGRRDFLKTGTSFVALSAIVPAFVQQAAEAATRRRTRGKRHESDRVLVVLQLAGGNDGLNTIVPVTNDAYYKARPKIAVQPRDTLKLNDEFGLHNRARGIKELFDAGYLSIVHSVGYPNPNRSHFKSMDIWHTASPTGRQHDGWLGRYFDRACKSGTSCPPSAGIALTPETPLAMRGRDFLPLAFEKPETLNWYAAVNPTPTGKVVSELNQPKPNDPRTPGTSLEYLRRVALEAQHSARQIRQATRGKQGAVEFPGGDLAHSLRTVSRLIAAGLETRVYYVSHNGYDTHANQGGPHGNLLGNLGDALLAFFKALKAQGNLDRVLVMAFSEFGRRVSENGSNGTDHGAAGPMFLMGSKVQPGFHGTMPDLANLDAGDLKHTTDFRSVYAAVLHDWLKTDSARILGSGIKKLKLIV